jgi:serine/threonine protein kinase
MTLVHRDVSPSNVLLSRAGEVKLTDFGIAKRAEQDVTQGGAVRGKFAYISPEQARNEPLDPRSDVFSVGILMWELACNRRLFSGLDDLAALRAVRDASAPRPTEIDRSLPVEFDQLVMSALSRDKARRFASCGQLGQKLRSLRYSLDVTSGDPATELAKIIDSTEEVERQSQQMIAPPRSPGRYDFDGAEATVIRIRTAAEFSARDHDISQARQVIDRFEEEETRLANLSSDQMRMLRTPPRRDSGELTSEAHPIDRAERRARRDSADDDEMTRAREPIDLSKVDDYEPALDTPGDATRLIAPRDRRTPTPGVRTASPHTVPRASKPSTMPPPMLPRGRGPTPGPPLPGLPPATRPSAPVLPMAPMPQPPGSPFGGPSAMGADAYGSPMNAPPMNARPMPSGGEPPFIPSPPPGGWGAPFSAQHPVRDPTPTARDSFDQPVSPRARSMPQVAGFGGPRKQGVKPWMLVVGALLIALLAFAITRAFIS